MQILRNGTQPSVKHPEGYFTGNVRIDMPFKGAGDVRTSGAIVTFEHGARRAWHNHPLAQVLIVTSGKGWTPCEGEPIVEISAGDIITCPPGRRHWRGATDDGYDAHRPAGGAGRQGSQLEGERIPRRSGTLNFSSLSGSFR